MKTHPWPLIAALAALVLSPSLFAAAPAPERDQRNFEIRFLRMMIDHHEGAIQMARLCEGRAVHEELLELCDQIVTEQSMEQEMMQSWLQDWYGITKEPQLDRKTRRTLEYLSRLNGPAFEKAFMRVMIDHHVMALESAIDCLLEAYHADLINSCSTALASQGEEIALMRLWLCDWYQICDLDRRHHH